MAADAAALRSECALESTFFLGISIYIQVKYQPADDEGQTVTIKEKPERPDAPEKPEQPQTPDTLTKSTDSPKTGDSTNLVAFILMLVASGGGLAGTYFFKRRRMKKS